MPDCSPNIRRDKSQPLRMEAGRRDWPDESAAPAWIRQPSEGLQVCRGTNVFEPRDPAPLKRSGKDSGASAPGAVPVVAEYREKLVEGLEPVGPVRRHSPPSAGGNHRGSPPAPDCFQ